MTRRHPRDDRRAPLRRALARCFEGLEPRQLMCAAHDANDPVDIWFDPGEVTADHALMAAAGASLAATGTPVLHSLPGAPAAIYLDFDGEGSREAYDIDGDTSSFNAAEQANITTAWSRVAAYFAMFNVDVTTVMPSVPFAWQLTTPDEGGWSYVGVFPDTASGGPSSFNAESSITSRTSAYAHELGHNFGMQHQAEWNSLGVRTAEYTDGYDDQHGSIMGTDYARNVRKWFWGHDTTSDGAYTLQDDMAIVAADLDNYGGDGYRTDDYASTIAGATALTTSGINQVGSGIIERRTDADMFKFTASAAGRYLIEASRAIESGVDLKIEIQDASGRILAAEDVANQNEANVAVDLPAGTYYVLVSGHGNYADQGMYNVQVSPIAAGFDSADTGVTRRPGNVSYDASSGTWTMIAGGSPVTTSTGSTDSLAFDELRYAYTKLSGNGTIIGRVASFGGSDADSFAGLMIRESMDSNSRYAAATVSPGNFRFARRTTAGSNYTSTNVTRSSGAPMWLKLERVGNTFTASRSTDGTTWTAIGSTTITMGSDVLIGLASTSRVDQATITSTFDNVSLSGAGIGGPSYPQRLTLDAPANVAVSLGVGSGLVVGWSAVAAAVGGYAVQRSLDGSNFDDIATVAAGVLSYADNALAGSYRYFYRVLALDAVGRSAPSAMANAINRPSAVTGVKTMSISPTMIVVDWIDTVGESGYKVERSADGGATWTVLSSSLATNRPSYTDSTGLVGSTTYQYRVTPLSSLGDGVTSAIVSESTRLPVVSASVGAVTSSSVTIDWTPLNETETSYKLYRSTDNSSWTLVTTLPTTATTYTFTGLSALTRYYFRVQGANASTESVYATQPVATLAATSTPITPPWNTADIGDTIPSGSLASLTGTTYTMIANGSDIGTTSDDLHFMYQTLSGDGSITARVASLDGPDGAEVGLMFRASLAANAPYAMALLTNDADSRFMRRSTVGGSTSSTNGANKSDGTNVDAPYWLRLTRTGTAIKAEQSADGVTWVQIGSTATLANLGGTIYMGLALSSQSALTMAKATFTNVSVVGATVLDTTPPAAPILSGITNDTGASATDRITSDATLVLTGAAEAGATVKLTLNGTPIGSVTATAGGGWTFDYRGTTLVDGTYTFGATATDAAGNVSAAGAWGVTIDTAGPQRVGATFDREVGHKWVMAFDEDVSASLSRTALTIVDRITGNVRYPTAYSWDAATRTVTFGMDNGSRLDNSRYEARLTAGVTDLAGNVTAVAPLAFDVLAGDCNGDGKVDFADLLTLAKNYGATGRTYSQGNVDYSQSGDVTFGDLLLLAKAYNTSVPPLPAASAASAGSSGVTRKRDAGSAIFASDAAVV